MVEVMPPIHDIEGVSHEAALGIEKMLKQGRRYFGSSGASLTHQAFNPAYSDKGINSTLAKIGLEGERDTTLFLKEWMKDKPNVVLIDSVHILGWGKEEVDEETGIIEGGDTDHILVIGKEVILIDTKRWKGKKNYTVSDTGSVLRTNKEFPGGKVQIVKAAMMWLDFLEDDELDSEEVSLIPIVCINAEDVVVFRNRNWFQQNYRLVEKARLAEFLDQKYEKISEKNKNSINTTIVSQIALNCVEPFDNYKRIFSKEALKSFK